MNCDQCEETPGRERYYKEGKIKYRMCKKCNGLGKIIPKEKEIKSGIFITERPEALFGVDHLFNWYENNRMKAYVKTKIRGIQKVLDLERNLLDKKQIAEIKEKVNKENEGISDPSLHKDVEDYILHDDYLVIDIEDMGIKNKKDRGKGYMHKMLNGGKDNDGNPHKGMKAFFDNVVRYINTSWTDSSKEGREYLLKQGFVRNKTVLMWTNPLHKQEDGTLLSPSAKKDEKVVAED